MLPWVIVITAILGQGHDGIPSFYIVKCPTEECVQTVIAQAQHSPRASEVRVWKPGDFIGDSLDVAGGATGAQPYIDLKFS